MVHKTWSDYSNYFASDDLITGFTNRYFPYHRPADRVEFAKALQIDHKYIVEPVQVHSNNVVIL